MGTLPNLEGNSIQSLHTTKGRKEGGRKITPDGELPRLTGTKSQASTASSSATRDSGISLNEVEGEGRRAVEARKSGGGYANRNNKEKRK